MDGTNTNEQATVVNGNAEFSAKILWSLHELSFKERARFGLCPAATTIDSLLVQDGVNSVDIDVANAVTVQIHNEASENKDYTRLYIEDKNGTLYSTLSSSAITSALAIFNAMNGCEEKWALVVTKQPSKDRAGKFYYKCDVR